MPAGDLVALSGCELQEEGLKITLGNLGLLLGYSDMPLGEPGDLTPSLLGVQKVVLTPFGLLQ